MKFKEGDLVVCINPGRINDIFRERPELEKGKGYRIREFILIGHDLPEEVALEGIPGSYVPERFIKIEI